MDDTRLWLIGALALVVVVAALIWVLRHRSDALSPATHHDYGAPEVTVTGQGDAGRVTHGGQGDEAVDQTVPLSRLGGAGWRDGGGVTAERTTDGYAGASRSWDDSESAAAPDRSLEHHVEVEPTDPRRAGGEDPDRDRGGQW